MAVTIDDVKAIIDTDLTDDQITAFIATAKIILDRMISNCPTTFTSDEQDQIQTYITAHLITLREPLQKTEKFEQWSVTNMRHACGCGIMGSEYGQMANMLSQGCLQNMQLRKVQVLWV